MGNAWSCLHASSLVLDLAVSTRVWQTRSWQTFKLVDLRCDNMEKLLAALGLHSHKLQKTVALGSFSVCKVQNNIDWDAVEECFCTHALFYEYRVDNKRYYSSYTALVPNHYFKPEP